MAKSQEVKYFRNTSTDLVEEVTNEATIELMSNSDRYVAVDKDGKALKGGKSTDEGDDKK